MKVPSDNTELVYTSITGVKVYAFKDITRISAFRGVAAEKAKRFASLNISHEEFKKIVDYGINAINQRQDFVGAISSLQELRFRNEMICEENSLLDLACIFLMIEGEDEEKPTEEFNKKKVELAQAHPDIRAFFLREALGIAGKFSQKPGADLLTYLEETSGILQARIKKFTQ